MNMILSKTRALLAALLMIVAAPAMANGFELSAGYANISDDDDGIDVSLDAAVVTLGYQIEFSNFSVIPQFRLGAGVGDDSVDVPPFGTADVSLKTVYGVGVRGEMPFGERFYGYLQGSYMNFDLEVDLGGGMSGSDDEWEFGLGGGVGFAFDKLSVEVSAEDFDGALAVMGGVRYRF